MQWLPLHTKSSATHTLVSSLDINESTDQPVLPSRSTGGREPHCSGSVSCGLRWRSPALTVQSHVWCAMVGMSNSQGNLDWQWLGCTRLECWQVVSLQAPPKPCALMLAVQAVNAEGGAKPLDSIPYVTLTAPC